MRISLVFKLALLGVLALCCYFVTSTIFVSQVVAQGEVVPDPTIKITSTRKDWPQGVHPPAVVTPNGRPILNPSTIARTRMRGFTATANGTLVNVKGRAYIFDTRPKTSYVWCLRVFDPDQKQVLLQRFYDKQIFQVPASKELNPTFQDLIELAPGTYRIELTGYEIPSNLGLENLKDRNVARPYLCFGDSGLVTTTQD